VRLPVFTVSATPYRLTLSTPLLQDAHVNRYTFEEQYATFQTRGYTQEPSGAGFVGDAHALAAAGGDSVFNQRASDRKRKALAVFAQVVAAGDEAAGDGDGGAVVHMAKPLADHSELTPEQREYIAWHNARRDARRKKPAEEAGGTAAGGAAPLVDEEAEPDTGREKSHFHGASETNYAGDSWIAAPKDKKRTGDECFLPKRWVHTYAGHTKGVSAIRFFPGTGHLLLSAGLDNKVKIWDVFGSGKLLRTYMGHNKGVKDVWFTNDGTRFVSSSYDNDIKLWDTETGKVVQAVTAGKVANCVRLHPHADKQHTLLAGLSDRRVGQWDLRTGDMTQEYDQHLAAVNCLAFIDEGRRFVSSSDDKALRVWEFGIPVTIKLVADPGMHSQPQLACHPTAPWLAAQSLDNSVVVYSTKERFKLNAKKQFRGHSVAGYACALSFSWDGRFMASGDGDGKLFVWDWKTGRILRTLKCHDQVTIGCEWHPLEVSKLATCSWDGSIKLWD